MEFLISQKEFETFDIDVVGWVSGGVSVSLLLYFPNQMYDEEGSENYLELTIGEIDKFCDYLQSCKDKLVLGVQR